ncbi:hypothetical protein GDO86_015436 [Hymenochirus boettgeri]|uniref:Fibronectin type-III domain-containing protein n=1 Tax=Hymenochirus boettgeri TaxID=247094 RepID=A0A8T2JSY1_9PIPI|nr:hypothetical protein GDO86_015436 [Hymenochirus boettgeri]
MLDIVWKAPYLKDFHGDCTVLYELRYQNGAGNRWRSIRTQHYKHRAAFNLSNGIFVKIRTLLKGSCTNEPQMWSDWIDTNYSAPVQGTVESQIQNFQCTYYNWKALQCVWKPGKLNDFSSNYELHYWHKGLPQNMSCSSYLRSDGKNTGCIFQSQDLEHYTDFFVCISGTSDSYLVRPSYFVFQLQDIVKPAPPKELSITTTNPNEIVLEWKLPEETIPLRCLKFEIRYKEQDNIWKDTSEVQQTMSIIRKSNTSHIFCARVRDKVNQFCADDGFWSEWSPEVCWEAPFEYKYVYIFGGCFTVLGACMTAGIFAVRTKR